MPRSRRSCDRRNSSPCRPCPVGTVQLLTSCSADLAGVGWVGNGLICTQAHCLCAVTDEPPANTAALIRPAAMLPAGREVRLRRLPWLEPTTVLTDRSCWEHSSEGRCVKSCRHFGLKRDLRKLSFPFRSTAGVK